MFGWLQDLLRSIVDAITGGFASAAKAISDSIWNAMMRWLYNSVYSAIADFFTMMGMGAEIFDLAWIRAIVQLFTLFGWGLFTAGAVVAIFDLAVEYQSGRANIKNTLLNILKGFFACSLIGLVPIELYKFCISLQSRSRSRNNCKKVRRVVARLSRVRYGRKTASSRRTSHC